jgi:hypothetical protein
MDCVLRYAARLPAGNAWGKSMSDSKLLKAVKTTIHNFASLEPGQLVERLRKPESIKKLKKLGVNDAQIHRVILILQDHKPNSKEFLAYLNSKLV